MKKETTGCSSVPSQIAPEGFLQTDEGRQIQQVLTVLERHRTSCSHEKLLLLLEQSHMDTLLMLVIECFLRHNPRQRLLLLVSQQRKATLLNVWEQATSWEDGRPLSEHFSLSSTPQKEAQVCLATVFDIQMQIGIHAGYPFFKAFGVLLAADVPAIPGPGWNQIVDLLAASTTCVIGFSSTLSEEEGKLLFGTVIDARSLSGSQL